MDYDLNRLAKGLMREELRKYPLGKQEEISGKVIELFQKFKLPYAQKMGLTAKQLAMVKSSLAKTLNGFQHRFEENSTEYNKGAMKGAQISSAFTWSLLETAFERPGGDLVTDPTFDPNDKFRGFKEQSIQLGFQRTMAHRKTANFIHLYQRITLSDHVLYRMLDREVCDREPLAYLSNRIRDWLPYINALMLVGCVNGFIPFEGGGLVLQTYNVVEPDNAGDRWFVHDRFLVGSVNGQTYFQESETPSPTNYKHPTMPGGRCWQDFRITTYLTDAMMCSSKLWVKLEFQKLKERFPDHFDRLPTINTMWDMDRQARELLDDPHSDFIVAMRKFTTNPKFLDAARSSS